MIDEILKYSFLQNALISAILASIVCGIIGTIIMEKKLVMMSGGISHTAFGGIGMGYYLHIEPIIGALVFAVSAALGISTIKRKSKSANTDILIGLFWSMGMAIGILFIALTPGYPPDISSYLFGDILTVSKTDITLMLILNIIIVTLVIALFNLFKAYLFDEAFVKILGVNTVLLEYVLFILIAFTIVILIRVIGIILIMALLTAPCAIAKNLTLDLKKMMIYSVLLGMFFCITGLWVSYEFNIASGASIVLLAGMTYVIVAVVKILIPVKKLDNAMKS